METIEDKIKNFLYIFPYKVMYEKHKSDSKEVFFCVIEKNDIKDTDIHDFLSLYEETYPIKNILSAATAKFIDHHKKTDYFIWVDSVDHKSNFFLQKKEHIMENANNIICIRVLGEPSDKIEHLEHVTQKNLKKLKILSNSIFQVIKEDAEEKIESLKPKIKENVNKIKKKIIK